MSCSSDSRGGGDVGKANPKVYLISEGMQLRFLGFNRQVEVNNLL